MGNFILWREHMRPVKTIEDILLSLENWREERGLQRTVGNIAANIGEEIVEYLRAENDEQRVDALCDMFVFSVNAVHAIGSTSKRGMIIQVSDNSPFHDTYLPNIVECFSDIVSCETWNSYRLLCLVQYSKYQIQYLGYDFLIAMDETLKEIHSRKGAWNDETQKWEKFKTEEAMVLWYKADYSKAKVA